MTGTLLDAVDMAVLETDGHEIQAFGPAGERKLRDETRDLLLVTTEIARGWPRDRPEPEIFAEAARAVADEHIHAAESFLAEHGLAWSDFDLLGVHGQTVLHERPTPDRIGRTVQLLDAEHLAKASGRSVAFDFRTPPTWRRAGRGAAGPDLSRPPAPGPRAWAAPVAALNIGGVANITLINDHDDLLAFDTGPGNGMIDLDAAGARPGPVRRERPPGRVGPGGPRRSCNQFLSSSYFSGPAPKSLDRYDFPLDLVEPLSAEDAAATLVAFTAEAVIKAFDHGARPSALIVCGGGRHNPQIMRSLIERAPVPVKTAEDYGWRGDSIEAEAFAYLAARTAAGLPISFPGTTGVKAPMTGGRIVTP
ncbi:anhydro-N-acetylmuramic acid kinase [Caulobacter segnis]